MTVPRKGEGHGMAGQPATEKKKGFGIILIRSVYRLPRTVRVRNGQVWGETGVQKPKAERSPRIQLVQSLQPSTALSGLVESLGSITRRRMSSCHSEDPLCTGGAQLVTLRGWISIPFYRWGKSTPCSRPERGTQRSGICMGLCYILIVKVLSVSFPCERLSFILIQGEQCLFSLIRIFAAEAKCGDDCEGTLVPETHMAE